MTDRREANRRLSEAMLSWADYSGMEPRPEGTYAHHVFRDHNCGGCDSGAKPCREGNYDSCSYPRARND